MGKDRGERVRKAGVWEEDPWVEFPLLFLLCTPCSSGASELNSIGTCEASGNGRLVSEPAKSYQCQHLFNICLIWIKCQYVEISEKRQVFVPSCREFVPVIVSRKTKSCLHWLFIVLCKLHWTMSKQSSQPALCFLFTLFISGLWRWKQYDLPKHQWTTLLNMPQDITIHIHCSGRLKSEKRDSV